MLTRIVSMLVPLGLAACSFSPGGDGIARESLEFDLRDEPWAQASVAVDAGEFVEVAVTVRQVNDEVRLCGRPTVKDAFNNPVIELKPRRTILADGNQLLYDYGYAFHAAVGGEYKVFLDNADCVEADVPAFARVTWTVSDSAPN